MLSGILEERDSNGGTSGPFLGPDARTKRDEDAADAKRAAPQRREETGFVARRPASAAAVVAAEAEASRLAAERAKSARAGGGGAVRRRRGCKSFSATGRRERRPADARWISSTRFVARSAATPRWMPPPTTRAPHIASDGEASGGAAASPRSSLASRLAKPRRRARRRRGVPRPHTRPVTESFAPPRFEDGRDSDVAGTTDGDGFDFGRLTVRSGRERRARRGDERRRRRECAPLFARDGGARAGRISRNAAAGRAPPERRAFASLLAEGAAVAAKQAARTVRARRRRWRRARRGRDRRDAAAAGVRGRVRRPWSAPTH